MFLESRFLIDSSILRQQKVKAECLCVGQRCGVAEASAAQHGRVLPTRQAIMDGYIAACSGRVDVVGQ